jgi:hypothetical protein
VPSYAESGTHAQSHTHTCRVCVRHTLPGRRGHFDCISRGGLRFLVAGAPRHHAAARSYDSRLPSEPGGGRNLQDGANKNSFAALYTTVTRCCSLSMSTLHEQFWATSSKDLGQYPATHPDRLVRARRVAHIFCFGLNLAVPPSSSSNSTPT